MGRVYPTFFTSRMTSKSALDVVSKLAKRKSSDLRAVSAPAVLHAAQNASSVARNGWRFADASSSELRYDPLEVPGQAPVPQLANKLDRVLFNPGVNYLKDPRTNVYNFDSRLEQIMSITDFDFSLIAPYVPAGRDSKLSKLANENGLKFTGSTSSMTPVLTQFHHALSHNRPPQIMNLPKYYPGNLATFSNVQRAPTSMWLVRHPNTETYAVTMAGSSQELILTLLGQAMESMLTTECSEFTKWSKRHPENHNIAAENANPASTYNYTTSGRFLMRSQLDCYDPRLPGTGMFDLKTRACCAIRHDIDYAQIQDGSDYQILKTHGQYESFSREFYELVRSAMFKYSLQARIGRMDGIFVAYHSVRRLFGFEYLPLSEIDKIYHTAQLVPQDGSSAKLGKSRKDGLDLDSRFSSVATLIADSEFKLSIELLGRLFDTLHERISNSSEKDLNIVVHCNGPGKLLVFARAGEYDNPDEPKLMGYEHSKELPQDLHGFQVTFTQSINNKFVPSSRYPSLNSAADSWRVSATMEPLSAADLEARFKETQAQYVYQELTSEPRTDELPDAEELKTMLSKLPEATELQAILRKYGEMGSAYAAWDEQRPKIEL